ncbi:MAG: formate dehydrogenase accessory sulfurtransferase FdhD [Rhodocyclaceae bacterium]
MKAVRQLDAQRIDAQGQRRIDECVAEEVAVALCYNGVSHAVMMASPQDLEDFARGFSLTEGIVEQAAELRDIEISETDKGLCVSMQIPERRMVALKEMRRSLAGRTGCGLCGAESLEQAIRPIARVTRSVMLAPGDVQRGFAAMQAQQALNHATGAVHAAALWQDGQLLVREDIGRHNALDKLVGAMQAGDWSRSVLLLTSRASYEMLHKAASANIPLVAAISAPSARAIALAQEAGITLIGFARGEAMTVYSERA